MSNLDDILRLVYKRKRVKKIKFQKGDVLKLVSLLGIPKAKVIKSKHRIPVLTGQRTQRLIGIDLTGAAAHRRAEFKSNVPGRNRETGTPYKKFDKETVKTYKKFGRNLGIVKIRQLIEKYDHEGQYGAAQHVLANKKKYSKGMVQDAKTFLMVHKKFGAPGTTELYFKAKYGNAKVNTLKDDRLYQELKKSLRQAQSDIERNKIRRLLSLRKKQLSFTVAELMWTEHKALEREKRGKSTDYLEKKYNKMIEPSTKQYWSYIAREVNKMMDKKLTLEDEKFFAEYYAKFDGMDPGVAIGKSRKEHAYEKLMKGLIDNNLLLPLHPTNLHALKKSPWFGLRWYSVLTPVYGFERAHEAAMANLGDPENTSRSGVPDPGVNWYSLNKFKRITPKGTFPGIEAEQEMTEEIAERGIDFDKKGRRYQKEKTYRENMEADFRSTAPNKDLADQFVKLRKYKKDKIK